MWVGISCCLLTICYSIISCYLYKLAKTHQFKKEHTTEIWEVISKLGLYPLVYIFQWSGYGLLKLHLIEPTFTNLLIVVCTANTGGMLNFLIYYPLLLRQIIRHQTAQYKTHSSKNSKASKKSNRLHITQLSLSRQAMQRHASNNSTSLAITAMPPTPVTPTREKHEWKSVFGNHSRQTSYQSDAGMIADKIINNYNKDHGHKDNDKNGGSSGPCIVFNHQQNSTDTISELIPSGMYSISGAGGGDSEPSDTDTGEIKYSPGVKNSGSIPTFIPHKTTGSNEDIDVNSNNNNNNNNNNNSNSNNNLSPKTAYNFGYKFGAVNHVRSKMNGNAETKMTEIQLQSPSSLEQVSMESSDYDQDEAHQT